MSACFVLVSIVFWMVGYVLVYTGLAFEEEEIDYSVTDATVVSVEHDRNFLRFQLQMEICEGTLNVFVCSFGERWIASRYMPGDSLKVRYKAVPLNGNVTYDVFLDAVKVSKKKLIHVCFRVAVVVWVLLYVVVARRILGY